MSRQHLSWQHLLIKEIYQLLLTQLWPNFLNPILCRPWIQILFWTKFCLTKTFLNRNFMDPKILWTQNIGTLIFLAPYFLAPNFFEPKSFLTWNLFGPKLFWTWKFFESKISLNKNLLDLDFFYVRFFFTKQFLWTQNFLCKIFFG